MADDNQPPAPGTPPEATPPPAPPAQPPANPPTPPAPPAPPANPYPELGAILKPIADGMTAVLNGLAGLPETIANAVSEKTQPPKPAPPPEGDGTNTDGDTGTREPWTTRFAKYWTSH